MTWVQIAKREHDCVLPDAGKAVAAGYPTGSLWRCDDCGQNWELSESFKADAGCWSRRSPIARIDATITQEVLP